MRIEQARAIVEERPHLHVARDGSTKDGGLNRRMGEQFIAEIAVLDLPYLPDWRMEPFITANTATA